MSADLSRRRLYAVFFFAGIPALIYQVTWQRAFGLYFGVDVYSATVTVATFMAGLGFGAMVGGALAARVRRPIVVYASIELLLGLLGAVSPWCIQSVGGLVAGAPLATIAATSAALMLVPTFLMGATLPVMSSVVVQSDASLGAQLSMLYGINTFGAGCGALLSAYALIGWFGLDGAAWFAAGLNFILAIAVIAMARGGGGLPPPAPSVPTRDPNKLVYVLAFGSGLISLGYEIVWYRLLGVILHGTVYVFGTILAVFLLGIAVGSLRARTKVDAPMPLSRFAWAQVAMSAYVLLFSAIVGYGSGLPGIRHVLSASFFTSFHPSPMIREHPFSLLNIYSLVDIPLWTVAMLGVPTFLMGFGFPHLLRAAASGPDGVSVAVGRVYAVNIVGSILGTLLVGFVALRVIGSERTLQFLIILGALMGALAARGAGLGAGAKAKWPRAAAAAGLAVAVLALGAPAPGRLVRATHFADFSGVTFDAREDTSGVVALRRQDRVIAFAEEAKILGVSKLHIDGAAHGRGNDSEAREWSTAMAVAATPSPTRVLSIGLGDGVMCDSVLHDPKVEELVIVELNGKLLELLATTARGSAIAASPKLRYINDDGRRWLNANPQEKFDLIVTFPLHPAHAGYGNLFSLEFFALVRAHLTPGGVFFARSTDGFSTARTLAEAFPTVLRVDYSGYIATTGPIRFSTARLPFPADELAERIEADRDTILANTKAVPINRDLRPHSEFYLTYPWASYLLATKVLYTEPDRNRFMQLVGP